MVQGRGINASLNDKGREQAKQVYQAFSEVAIDRIYTSALVRTQETVHHFELPKRPLEGFDEISWGTQEGVVPSKESRSLFEKTVEDWKNGRLDECVGGGESPNQVMKRQRLAMKKVLTDSGEIALICMHGRAIRIMMCWLLNYPLQFMDGFKHRNCCYYKLKFSEGVFVVEAFNQTGHLRK